MDNKSIYIVLSNTGTLITKMIGMYTKVPYNHVSISLDIELNEIYSFGRKRPKNPLFGGFVREYTNKGTFAYFKDTTCSVYEIKVNKNQYEEIKSNIDKFKSKKNMYYFNILGFVFVVLNIPVKFPYGYFCSHFVSQILEDSNVKLFNKKSTLVTPIDFYKLHNVNMIYEGKLCEYKNPLLESCC